MDFTFLAFVTFAAAAVASAIAVVGARNPVHAALFLVLTFFSVACTWLVAGAEFLGIVLVLVYVGAVMVLFLFVVMMLDVDVTKLREGFVRHLPIGLIVAAIMVIEVLALLGVKGQMGGFGPDVAAESGLSNTTWLAQTLYTKYLLPFELAAVILTVAAIAAVTLTLRRRLGVKQQNPAEQSRVDARHGRVRMVAMQAETPEPARAENEETQP